MIVGAPEVVVLRWGHRERDKRLTTHVILTARAFGASGVVLTDVTDAKLMGTVKKVVQNWGGPFFFRMGMPWKKALKYWRSKGFLIVHLTAYGENIATSNIIQMIRATGKNILVIVGSKKTPGALFSPELSDFNVAVGNQPHSECSSLAVFLDRLLKGKGLSKKFEGGRLRIVPQKHGKKVERSSPKGKV